MSSNKVNFSFGWLALKLLGKSLYSNAWSAISELVANGFDARAEKVYVYIDAIDRENAVIEIIDNGTGMSPSGIEIYAKVGFNRRTFQMVEQENFKNSKDNNSYQVMGRKGIGKLAALYLSENYYLLTKTSDTCTAWKMVYNEDTSNEEERPFLEGTTVDEFEITNSELWSSCATGTLLRLNKVNLTGLGNVAYESLEKKLSNYFSLDSMGNRQIFLCVRHKTSDSIEFKPVQKEIAFKNMAFIEYNFSNNMEKLSEKIQENKDVAIKMPYNKLPGKYYSHVIELSEFPCETNGTYVYTNSEGNQITKEYHLSGWIGLHSTIDINQATENDARFNKSRFYNPIQLRLYVRNKLAIENFLNILNNTQAFSNYIEGEIHFDILDDDDLPDIATSNRQGLDENDPRIELLSGLLSKIVSNLIGKRTELATKIKEQERELEGFQRSTAKKQFSEEVDEEIGKYKGLDTKDKATLSQMVTSKIQGEVIPKNDYIVFISHSRADKCIADFFYFLLKARGFKNSEFFYTSRDDTSDKYTNAESLSTQIKNNIVRDNTLLLYLTSKDYKNSEYCMFEGGAGWATRSVSEYIVLSLTYNEIPKFITNGKMEFCLEKARDIPFNREAYYFIRATLNRIIEHINRGRRVLAEPLIPLFEETEIPNDLLLTQTGKAIEDYMDNDIKRYWDFYVGLHIDEYMERRYSDTKDHLLSTASV